MWQVITDLVADGTTVLLTTQYLEEADQLAHDIVVIDHGQVIARGDADALKAQVGGERLVVTIAEGDRLAEVAGSLRPLGIGDAEIDDHTRTLTLPVTTGTTALVEAVRMLGDAGVTVQDIGIRRPTLDDAFLSLTGHRAEESTDDTAEEQRA